MGPFSCVNVWQTEKLRGGLQMWHLYIIEKGEGYYVGITTDIAHRLRQHGAARILYQESFACRENAAARERQIKGWSRKKKEEILHIRKPPRR